MSKCLMSDMKYHCLDFVKTIHLVGGWQSWWPGGYHYQGNSVNLVHIPQKVRISKAHHQTWQRQMTKSILVQCGGALSFSCLSNCCKWQANFWFCRDRWKFWWHWLWYPLKMVCWPNKCAFYGCDICLAAADSVMFSNRFWLKYQ